MITEKGQRAKRTMCVRIDVHYLHDGTMRYQLSVPDKRKKGRRIKWRMNGCGFFGKIPTWEQLHKFLYVGEGRECESPPGPIETLIRHMQYDVHCMAIRESRHPQHAPDSR